MSQNIGTLVGAAIRPNDSLDLIASAFANEIKGGVHGYATLAERDAIIEERREWGMLCVVYNDGTDTGTYQLIYGLVDTDINNNANWQSFSGGGSLHKETPSGDIDDSNVTFTVDNVPFFINVNGGIYDLGDGAYASLTPGVPNIITLAYPVGSGGFIKSYY